MPAGRGPGSPGRPTRGPFAEPLVVASARSDHAAGSVVMPGGITTPAAVADDEGHRVEVIGALVWAGDIGESVAGWPPAATSRGG